MIREALERLSRPLRRRLWGRRRQRIVRWNAEESHQIPVPITWEERPLEDVELDVHRWVEGIKKRLHLHYLIDPRTGRVALFDPETGIIDMGGMQARMSDVEAFLQRAKKDLKKKRFVDPETGKLDASFNPLAMDDGACPPVRESAKSKPDKRWSPVENGDCILLPCRQCQSLTCSNPEEHFGFTYEEFLNGSEGLE